MYFAVVIEHSIENSYYVLGSYYNYMFEDVQLHLELVCRRYLWDFGGES